MKRQGFIYEVFKPRKLSKITTMLLEMFASFCLVTFLILPGSYNDPYTTLSNPLEVINEISLLMSLWIITISISFTTLFKRWSVLSNPLSVVYAKAKGTRTNGNLITVLFFQMIGAVAACLLVWFFMNWSGIWYDDVSTMAALPAKLKGFVYANAGMVDFTGQTWYYVVQGIIACITIIVAATINYVIEHGHFKSAKRQWMLKAIMTYCIVLFAFRFSANPINLWRIIIPALISPLLGGGNQIPTAMAIMTGQLIAYTYVIWLYGKNNKKMKKV